MQNYSYLLWNELLRTAGDDDKSKIASRELILKIVE